MTTTVGHPYNQRAVAYNLLSNNCQTLWGIATKFIVCQCPDQVKVQLPSSIGTTTNRGDWQSANGSRDAAFWTCLGKRGWISWPAPLWYSKQAHVLLYGAGEVMKYHQLWQLFKESEEEELAHYAESLKEFHASNVVLETQNDRPVDIYGNTIPPQIVSAVHIFDRFEDWKTGKSRLKFDPMGVAHLHYYQVIICVLNSIFGILSHFVEGYTILEWADILLAWLCIATVVKKLKTTVLENERLKPSMCNAKLLHGETTLSGLESFEQFKTGWRATVAEYDAKSDGSRKQDKSKSN